jgi:hypothetical protein
MIPGRRLFFPTQGSVVSFFRRREASSPKKMYLCRRFERGAVKAEIRPVEPDADNAAVGSFTTLLFPLSVCLIY